MIARALTPRPPDTPPDSPADRSSDVAVLLPVHTGGREAWETLFVSCLPTIDSIVAVLARRRRLSVDDAADLASTARLRIMNDDYAVLRKFRRQSSLRTYLTVVIQRLYLDERVTTLGKWRPSRRAQREGPTAVLFERLTKRDGLTFENACTALEIDYGLRIDRTALEALYATVRRSPRRRFVSADASLEELRSTVESPDEHLDMAERAHVARRARAALRRAIGSLTRQDRHIIELRFARGLSIADIARAMGLKQRTLYVRCGRLLQTLRSRLEDDGLAGGEVLKVIGRAELSAVCSDGSIGAQWHRVDQARTTPRLVAGRFDCGEPM